MPRSPRRQSALREAALREPATGPRWPVATLVLLAVVLAVKIALALTLAPHPLLQPVGDLDAGEYWRLAQRVAAGDVVLHGTAFYVSPLYIYWLALATTFAGGSVAGVLVLQAVMGTAAVGVAAQAAASWFDGPAAGRARLVTGGALALTGVVALQEALILQSALDPFLMALVAYTFTRALQAPSLRRWGWCGAALALLATNRPNAWLLAMVCAPAAFASVAPASARVRAVGAWVLGVAIVLAPFAIRTAVAAGEWQVLPGHGGLNFYIGNHAAANGTYTVVDGVRPSIEGQRDDTRRVAEAAEGRTLSDAEISTYFVRQSLAWWHSRPVDAVRLLAYKLWLTTHAWELPVNVSYAWFREQVWLVKALPVGAWLLVPLGLAGAIGGHLIVRGPGSESRSDSRPSSGSQPLHSANRQDAWRWFRWLLPVYLVSVAVFFVVDRYRAPALVLCAIHLGVIASMQSPRGWLQDGRAAIAAMALAVVTLVAGLVPLPFQLGQAEADTRMALDAIEHGRDDDGRAWLARAVARHPAPGVAWFRAGLGWQAHGKWADAERALREAHRLDPDVGDVGVALAGVLLTEGKGAEAVPLLEQAERAGVRPDRVRLDLSLALWQAGQHDKAREVLASGVPADGLPLLRARALAAAEARQFELADWLLAAHRRLVPGDAEVSEKLGLMRAGQGDTAGAAALFEEAARLDASRPTAHFNLAIARAQQGRRDEAIALLREALRLDPTYAQAAGALRELLGATD